MKKLIIAACVVCFDFASGDEVMSNEEAAAWKAEHSTVATYYENICTSLEKAIAVDDKNLGDDIKTFYFLEGYRELRDGEQPRPLDVCISYVKYVGEPIEYLKINSEEACTSDGGEETRTVTLEQGDTRLKSKYRLAWDIPRTFTINIEDDSTETIMGKLLNDLGCDAVILQTNRIVRFKPYNKAHCDVNIKLYNKNGRLVDRAQAWTD